MSMTKIRRQVERDIATRTIRALLDAGYVLSVHDGEEEYPMSTDPAQILRDMMQTDEDYLLVYPPLVQDRRGRADAGWVRFVYGNSGYDVISDYTTNLEAILQPVNAYADTLAD